MSAFTHFYKRLEENADRVFPSLKSLPAISWDHIVSPYEIHLPHSVLDTVQGAVRALYQVSRKAEYESLLPAQAGVSEVATRQKSVLMAYDFHTNEKGECFLVEVNTNASGFMLASLLNATHDDADPMTSPALADLLRSFQEELTLCGRTQNNPTCAIVDDDIAEQKMRLEFYMYREWLRANGWACEICEAHDLSVQNGQVAAPFAPAIDFIYNRTTDFYFEEPAHAGLREAFTRGLTCVSPQPKEYWRVADKERLIQLGEPQFLERAGASNEQAKAIRKVLIPSFQKTDFSSIDEIWSQRKNLFFKPKRSHGGKSVYRGESVSRRVFERLMAEDILIQHFVPAQKMPVTDPRSVLSNWKFDVRFYVYGERIQLATARLYQGQVTNFASALGGFTKVRF